MKSMIKRKVLPGFEPGTFCVLGRCDNHYTTAPVGKLRGFNRLGQKGHGWALTAMVIAC